MKENTDNTERWKDITCSWIGRVNILKIAYTTQGNLQIQFNPIKSPIAFFIELE